MSEVLKFPTADDVEEQAAAWVWRLDSEAATDEDRQAFQVWLRRDPRHRRAYEELARVWANLDDLVQAKRPEKIATFAGSAQRSRNRTPIVSAAVLAVATVAGVAVSLWYWQGVRTESFSTAVGQQRTVTLPDGSVVGLNTNTIVDTKLAAATRDVFLRKGEAHFTVAHDRTRPFVVHAGDTAVRAVGTEFDVRIWNPREVEVIVNEGRVEVQTQEAAPAALRTKVPDSPVPAPKVLVAGELLRTGPTQVSVQEVSNEEVSKSMAWRQGAVVFEGQTLSEAAAELSRYTDTRFVVTDPRIANLPVGGRFKTDDVQGFLSALEKAFPVAIRRAPDGLVYIEPQTHPQ